MPNVARKNGIDTVNTVHNAVGSDCDSSPTVIATDQGSNTVFAENVGIVRVGDVVQVHNVPGCSLHAPPLAKGSGTVFVENKPCGRIGDTYGGGEIILTGAATVIAG